VHHPGSASVGVPSLGVLLAAAAAAAAGHMGHSLKDLQVAPGERAEIEGVYPYEDLAASAGCCASADPAALVDRIASADRDAFAGLGACSDLNESAVLYAFADLASFAALLPWKQIRSCDCDQSAE